MGRDVRVSCRCWADGLTTEPPVSRDLIQPVDWTDPYRQVPEIRDGVTSRETVRAFDSWRERACAHRRMNVLAERVWKWEGTQVYWTVVAGLRDDDRFPVLSSIDFGYGDSERPMCAEDAGAALAELDRLAEHARTADLGELTEAVDVVSGARWWLHLNGFDPLAYQAPPWAIGLDRRGLFLWDLKAPNADDRVELVRAVRLGVRLGEPVDERSRQHHQRFQHATGRPCDCVEVTFTDLDTGARQALPMANKGQPFHGETHYRTRPRWPRVGEPVDSGGPVAPDAMAALYGGDDHYLRVWTRPILLADFADVMSALRRIFRAAADAGTAVVWG